MLKIGIIGLPNVGKSTLFNLITNLNVEESNYPFTTIEPNIGIVEVPDIRFDKLVKIFKPEKIIKPLIKFWDIAGLVKGASQGVGLGNKFLSHIREVTVLVHVIRFFEDENIFKDEEINPLKDLEIINLELIISDLEIVNKKWKLLKKLKKNFLTEKIEFEIKTCEKIIECLNNNKMLFFEKWNDKELEIIKSYLLLTIKKTLILINVSDDFFKNNKKTEKQIKLLKFLDKKKINYIFMPIILEKLLYDFSYIEKKEYKKNNNIPENIFDNFLRKIYKMLELETFFTCGEKEVRGWTFKKGKNAFECSGIIHTDFQKGFIRCKIISSTDLIELGSEQKVKELGKLRSEGREYIMKDGDICHFLFNI